MIFSRIFSGRFFAFNLMLSVFIIQGNDIGLNFRSNFIKTQKDKQNQHAKRKNKLRYENVHILYAIWVGLYVWSYYYWKMCYEKKENNIIKKKLHWFPSKITSFAPNNQHKNKIK